MRYDFQTRPLTNRPWHICFAVVLFGAGGMMGFVGGGWAAWTIIACIPSPPGGGYYGELRWLGLHLAVVVLAAGGGALLGSWAGSKIALIGLRRKPDK